MAQTRVTTAPKMLSMNVAPKGVSLKNWMTVDVHKVVYGLYVVS